MIGAGIWGDYVWADLYDLGRRPGRGAGLIGGEGFPPNWGAIIAQNAADDERERRRLEEEIAAMYAAGLL